MSKATDQKTSSPLTRGKSLDPKSIQKLEQEAFSVIAALNKNSPNAKSTGNVFAATHGEQGFTMETYQSDEEIKAEKGTTKKKSCCATQEVHPRQVSAQSEYSIANHCYELLPPPKNKDMISIVLDLDETLLHSSFVPLSESNFAFFLNATPAPVPVYVLIRPHAEEFIKMLGDKFELIIFTASNKDYADYCIDQIDPHHLIKHRLYRQSCSDLNGATVKDLALLNRNLKKVIIIDNSPMSYLLHPYNAIPISTWTEDKQDNELIVIAEELLKNVDSDDVYSFLVQKDQN